MKSNRGAFAIAVLLIVSQLSVPLAHATNPPESFNPDPNKMCAANLKTQAELALEQKELRDEALALIQDLKRTEKKIETRRNWNGRYENTTHREARHRFQQLKNALHFGQIIEASHFYRSLFSDLEFAYWKFEDNNRLIQKYLTLIKSGEVDPFQFQREIDALRVDNTKQLKIFGENFVEYSRVRKYLEAIAQKKSDELDVFALENSVTDEEAERASTLLKHLGIHDFDRLFPELNIPDQTPTIVEMEKLFKTNLLAYRAHLKRIAKEELKTNIKIVVLGAPMINFLRQAIYVLPLTLRRQVMNFLGLAYDVYVRDKYLPLIEKIAEAKMAPENGQTAQSPELTKKQLRLLRELNAQTNDELLLTFARVVSMTDDWELMKVYVESLATQPGADNATYQDFLVRMKKAETQARKIGELSLFYEESPADQMARLSLVSLSTVLGFATLGQVTVGWENIFQFIKSFVP